MANNVIIQTRSVLHLTLNLLEDGNVVVKTTVSNKLNALGRKNFLLTPQERLALLSFVHEELEKFAVERHDVHGDDDRTCIDFEFNDTPRLTFRADSSKTFIDEIIDEKVT